MTLAAGSAKLAENVMHFGRLLRAAGMPLGSQRVQLGLRALQVAGLASREDFHAVLCTCWLDRIEHRELFDQAFDFFWRQPELMGQHPAIAPPGARTHRRLGQALASAAIAPIAPIAGKNAPSHEDAAQTTQPALSIGSANERLHKADFDSMTADEWRQAQRLLAQLHLSFERITTRRSQPAARAGRPDWRATLQSMARHGGDLSEMRWRKRREQPAPLVLLADISGSMSRYSRMLLHFGHLLSHADTRVESFVFGTRLTRTTRLLKSRDPDLAVAQVVSTVQDWSGGTRITQSLHEFNQRWARRVLSGNATVLLISDGLEHGDTRALEFEMQRLHKSCRRLIWLNPLLRFSQFEPRAGGIRAMLPHVDRFLPAHNLHSLEQLVRVLASPSASH